MSQYRLAKAIGVDARRIHSIVRGQRSITAETALLLGRVFGTSGGFWLRLQNQFDLRVAKERLGERLESITTLSSAAPQEPEDETERSAA